MGRVDGWFSQLFAVHGDEQRSAYVISGSRARFEHASAEASKGGFHAVWVPGVFGDTEHSSRCAALPRYHQGVENLLLSHRHAWKRIATSGKPGAVLEDDATFLGPLHALINDTASCASVRGRYAGACLLWLGVHHQFMTTHALFVTPAAALLLLELTNNTCAGAGTDHLLRSACQGGRVNGRRWPALRCRMPTERSKRAGTFGKGYYVQDRLAVKPLLHTKGDDGGRLIGKAPRNDRASHWTSDNEPHPKPSTNLDYDPDSLVRVKASARLSERGFWRGPMPGDFGRQRICPPGAFWVTQVSGEVHARQALCLAGQLTRQRSICPLIVVHDDINAAQRLSNSTLNAFTARVSHVVPISSLVERAFADVGLPSPPFTAGMRSNGSRSNYQSRLSFAASKYWLWAFDEAQFSRLGYLDVDLLLMENIDELLLSNFTEPLAAASNGPLCQFRSFNSGVMVLKPSLQTLLWLLVGDRFSRYPWFGRMPAFDEARLGPMGPVTYAHRKTHVGNVLVPGWAERCAPPGCTDARCMYGTSDDREENHFGLEQCRRRVPGDLFVGHRRIQKSCEQKVYDQSVLNWHFADRWYALPRAFNVQPPLYLALSRDFPELVTPSTGMALPKILHYVGIHKPWHPEPVFHAMDATAMSGHRVHAFQLRDLWRNQTREIPFCQAVASATRFRAGGGGHLLSCRDPAAWTSASSATSTLACCTQQTLEAGRAGRCSWMVQKLKSQPCDALTRSNCPVACGTCRVCPSHPQYAMFMMLECKRIRALEFALAG